MWNTKAGGALLLAAGLRRRFNLARGQDRIRQVGVAALIGFFLACASSCNQKMAIQPKEVPLRESDLYPDGMSARPLPDNTVPRGHLEDDPAFYTGKKSAGTGAASSGAAVPTRPASGVPPSTPGALSPQGAARSIAAPGAGSGGPQIQASGTPANTPAGPGAQADIDYFPIAVTAELIARGQERFTIFCSPCHSRLGDGQGMIVKRGYRQPPSFHIDRLRSAPVGHFFDVITNGFGAMPDYAQQVSPRDRWAIIAYIRALQLSQHATLADVPQDKLSELEAGGQQK